MWVEPEDGPERDLVQPAARPARARAATAVSDRRPGPRARRAPVGHAALAVPRRRPGRPELPGTGELILIVEDEPEFRELVELWVTRHGWRTATAADGTEVIRRFEEEVPALVLLDLNLPGMDGWQVTEWIRSVGTTPVLMVTALGAEADVIRGLVAGADDYLTKPIRFPELIARIAAALRRARLLGGARRGRAARVRRAADRARHPPGRRATPAEVHLTPTEFRLLLHARPAAGRAGRATRTSSAPSGARPTARRPSSSG